MSKYKGTYSFRYYLLFAILGLSVFVLSYRIYDLQVSQKPYLESQGNDRSVRTLEVPAYRGMITDRNNEPLAISTPVSSIWINPKKFNLDSQGVSKMLDSLEMDKSSLSTKIAKYEDKEFLYLKRHVPPSIGDEIVKLDIPGVHVKDEYRRYYPHGEVTAHILGFTDIDDKGIAGLESVYDGWLQGKSGKRTIVKDRLGRHVDVIKNAQGAEPGKNIALSIDQRLQYLAYQELKKAVEKHKAKSGSVVVLDVESGEVLAMANQPSYNPNVRNRNYEPEVLRNRAVVDYYEPGSTMKSFSMASILENQPSVTPASYVNTSPGYLKLSGGVVRDIQNNGVLDLEGVLRKSSNIGITRLVLDMPLENLWETYYKLGFGYKTGINYPGESPGVLLMPQEGQDFVVATMSFGYRMAATTLQIARAYAILGSGGVRKPVTLIKQDSPVSGVRVLSSKVSHQVVDMLASVVSQPRSRAKVDGYHVAGKTGTARKLGKNGYEEGRHRSVMAGVAPAIDPKFAIVVTIDEPSNGQYYANQVSSPVFSKIASGALRLFNIQPDILDTQGVHVAQNEIGRT